MIVIVLQAIACALGVYQSRTENKRNIYTTVFAFNMMCLLVYLVIGELATVYSYALITVRSFTYIHKDKLNRNFIPIIFILLHVITGAISIDSPWQVLSVLAPAITCVYMWYCKNTQQLRIGNIVVATIWLAYNLHCELYLLCVNRVVTIVSNVVAFIQKRDKETTD